MDWVFVLLYVFGVKKRTPCHKALSSVTFVELLCIWGASFSRTQNLHCWVVSVTTTEQQWLHWQAQEFNAAICHHPISIHGTASGKVEGGLDKGKKGTSFLWSSTAAEEKECWCACILHGYRESHGKTDNSLLLNAKRYLLTLESPASQMRLCIKPNGFLKCHNIGLPSSLSTNVYVCVVLSVGKALAWSTVMMWKLYSCVVCRFCAEACASSDRFGSILSLHPLHRLP